MASFNTNDLDLLSSVLAQAADAEVMPRFGRLTASQVRNKSSAFDIVTDADADADEACEHAITSGLLAHFAGAVVIGEEACDRDPSLLSALASADLAFLIDPLDGTRNFASGLPLFGVMAAAVVRGEVVAGAIHDPVTGTTALACIGQGAWLQDRAGERTRMHVATPAPLSRRPAVRARSRVLAGAACGLVRLNKPRISSPTPPRRAGSARGKARRH